MGVGTVDEDRIAVLARLEVHEMRILVTILMIQCLFSSKLSTKQRGQQFSQRLFSLDLNITKVVLELAWLSIRNVQPDSAAAILPICSRNANLELWWKLRDAARQGRSTLLLAVQGRRHAERKYAGRPPAQFQSTGFHSNTRRKLRRNTVFRVRNRSGQYAWLCHAVAC